MNTIIKLTLIGLLTFFQACNSSKKTFKEEASTETEMKSKTTNQKLIADGYSVGTIKFMKEGDCSFIIEDEKSKMQYDPIGMDFEKYKLSKKESTKVYYKYANLRRANRCSNARPIQILDLQKM